MELQYVINEKQNLYEKAQKKKKSKELLIKKLQQQGIYIKLCKRVKIISKFKS